MRNSALTLTLRFGICVLCLAYTIPVQAQRNGLYGTSTRSGREVSFDVAIGAGYSQLGYNTAQTDLKTSTIGDYGINAHLGINYFFTTYFGIGVGADFTRYGQSVSLDDNRLVWNDVTDTDADDMVAGERYDHILAIYKWRERQQQLYIAPQLMLMSVVPFSHLSLQIAAGAEYGFCVQSSYRASGDIEHTGFYDKWGLTLYDVPAHGFYRTTGFAPEGNLKDRFANRQQLSIVGRIGVLIPLTRSLDLCADVLCKYAVYTSPGTSNIAGGNREVGFHENATDKNVRDPHYFIPEYSTLISTPVVSGKYSPFLTGIEIGIRYRLPLHKSFPCRCIAD